MDLKTSTIADAWSRATPFVVAAFLLTGMLLAALGTDATVTNRVLMVGLTTTGTPVVWRTLSGMFAGRFAADVVAFLAIVAAVALGQPFVGLVIVLMQTGGEALERHAEGRASAALRELEARAPRVAHRIADGTVTDVPVDEVVVGDMLLVRPGDMVPCNCVVTEGVSEIDASMLTGEPVPIAATPGTELLSGSINGIGALDVRATAVASESQYARIVQLVRSAQESKAPLQRIADRYAVWFTPLTIVVCVVAYAISGDPLRMLAVLAVATPCPLIIATPVAVLGGINSAARRHIIVRHGTAIEKIGSTTVAAFDKTGTLTIGSPRVARLVPRGNFDVPRLLRLASAVEQGSGHLLARTLVHEAQQRGIDVTRATEIVEIPGRGVEGVSAGQRVLVGSATLIAERYPELRQELAQPSGTRDSTSTGAKLTAHVAVDGVLAGSIEYEDRIRTGAIGLIQELRELGISRTLILSGDSQDQADLVGRSIGVQHAEGDLLPEQKLERIRSYLADGHVVMMVGDGTNDAPALSAATVGVALAGTRGGGITAESADLVILNDDLGNVGRAIRISRRTMKIAKQSIIFGLGLSTVGMLFAAVGWITPVGGAVIQEGIDLAVILNALRASADPAAGTWQPQRRHAPLQLHRSPDPIALD